MKRGVKIILTVAVVLLIAAVSAAGWLFSKAAPIGTGFVAKYLCSSTFISGRDPEIVFQEDVKPVNPLAKIVTYKIDRAQKSVSSNSLGLFGRTAIYRDGCGCSLVIGTTADEMARQKLVPPDFKKTRPRHRADLPWPAGGRGPVDPSGMGVDRQKLETALDAAFAEPGPEKPRKTRAVVVVYEGQLIAERYAPGFDKDMPLLGWSMSKTVTNALVGILARQKRLDVMQPAPVPAWQKAGDDRKKITLDQLLRMSSGLKFEEVYAPLYDATYMLYGSYDFGAYAAARPLETKPDAKWYYSSGTANIVAGIVRRAVEKDHEYYYRFIYEELIDKIGMFSAVLEPDSSGTFVGSSYTFATPRDWARFGLLYLQDGVWQGQRIFPAGWVKYTTTPTPEAPRGEYGAHTWLNAGSAANPDDRRWPSAPADAFAALGFQEQKVIVIPSKKLVLVRFGATADRQTWDTDEFIKNILASLP
ncbi:MAG: serine hydrolase [Desulfobacteraceae bacterium]|jgi:CubicO group peptidase (beta-lactamase class C family)|nr:serine hydrolase [Desulfobacteraceae bacterium]